MIHVRREKAELIAEILEACIDGASKTHIVTETNLNFRTVEPHISLLIEKGLVEVSPHRTWRRYRTTPEGREALKKIREVWRLLGGFDQD
jgi:predicted transcriptional regulator